MVWFCGGHGVCLTGSGEAGHVEHAVLSWLGRYLKRDTSVQTGPRFEWLADDARWRSGGGLPADQARVADGDHRPEDAADRADEPVRRR